MFTERCGELCQWFGAGNATERDAGRAGGLPRVHRRVEGRRRAHQAAPAPASIEGVFPVGGEEPGDCLRGRGPGRGGAPDFVGRAVVQRPAVHGHQVGDCREKYRAGLGRQVVQGHRRVTKGPAVGRRRRDHPPPGAEQAPVPRRAGGGRDEPGRSYKKRAGRRDERPALPPRSGVSGDPVDAPLPRGAVRTRRARRRVRAGE
mmetsp:Transcript_24313/g.68336  ORF Transcript_24313/g.68336 Transcript_24313/m.68336 type:complete len:203 (+) Transcript_24313:775-1383(+)